MVVGAVIGAIGTIIGSLAGAAWRYRSELAPLAVAGVVAWCAQWTHSNTPKVWPFIAAGTIAAVAVLAAFPARWRRLPWPWLSRGIERAYIALCVAIGGGWVAAATHAGIDAAPLPWLALAGTVLCAVPWWTHRRRRAKVRVERVLETWPDVADAAGLAGTRAVSAVVDAWGWTARIALPRGRTAGEVVAAVPAVESGLGAAPGTVRAEPDPRRADRAYLRVLDSDPHAVPIPYPRPAAGTASIHKPIPLGLFDDGTTVAVRFLRRNALIGGVTDSGKSGLLNVILGYLAQCPDVAIWGIDLKGGMELAPWAPVMPRFAATPEKAVAFLAAAVDEIKLREAEQVARGERVWEPTADRPALVIIIDEYVELPEAAHQHADTIARLGRAVAVNLIVATQRPTQKAMTNNAVRSQMDIRICLRVRERRDVTLILGDGMLSAGWHAHKLDLPGKFYVSAREPQFRTPRPARGYYITVTDIVRVVDEHGTYTPHPGPSHTDEPDDEIDTDTPDTNTDEPVPESDGHPPNGNRVAVIERPPTPERLLLDALRNAPEQGITVPELAQTTGKPRRWVYRRLQQFTSTGHAEQVSWGHWRTPPPPTETDPG
ncbi:FtsK/SpoIIIE domain-containing protein [Phytohabitans houttuyneae]|nr:FtsK/SpoIIIE domain-containing protein [Phytohabitans houttuyneae]